MKFDKSVNPPASIMIKGMDFRIVGNFLMACAFANYNAAYHLLTLVIAAVILMVR